MTALEIAADIRREALRLSGEAARLVELSMILEGRHHSLPDEVRATEVELRARWTPEQRAELARMEADWAKRQSR